MIEVNLANGFFALAISPFLLLAYYTLGVIRLKNKYKHIPGPEAKGY